MGRSSSTGRLRGGRVGPAGRVGRRDRGPGRHGRAAGGRSEPSRGGGFDGLAGHRRSPRHRGDRWTAGAARAIRDGRGPGPDRRLTRPGRSRGVTSVTSGGGRDDLPRGTVRFQRGPCGRGRRNGCPCRRRVRSRRMRRHGDDGATASPVSGPVLVHAGHPLVLLETIPTDATAQQRRAGTLRRSGCRGRAAAALHDEAGSSVLRVTAGPDGHPHGRVHPMSRPRHLGLTGREPARHPRVDTAVGRAVPPGQLPSGSGAMRRATAAAVRSDPVPVGWKGNGSARPCRSGPVDAAAGSGVHSGARCGRATPKPYFCAPATRIALSWSLRASSRSTSAVVRPAAPRGPGGPHRPGRPWPAARRTRS